jgi:AcrR family transcriptional regulator
MTGAVSGMKKNVNGASTMETLIEFGLKELKAAGSIEFNLESVLRESGVSRGSLYHHFGSRHGLISHCEAVLLKTTLKSENEAIRSVIESGKTGEEVFELLAAFTRINGSEQLMQQRTRRIRTLAAAVESEQLRVLIAESQMKGSRYLVESFQIAEDRGLIKPRVPVDALVYLIQAMFLGRILVDITRDPGLSDSINEATVDTMRFLLNPQP